ncbi:AzlD domain-containing protein [Actinophytocola xanthii]|uniref:Branched-chain amino acid transporter n=1 Tax=Actinophytocola xanthii TaxID=1912961 RepID=A0A1Q8CDS3_9PSEU|nr:AzlD domain-containing protein [Actinophytocola xanthii]OLF12506.1 branched-chain amino acid transporter [Actinophytocola xanthii]
MLLVVSIAVLAVGTFAFRFAGPALRSRITFPPQVTKLLETASVVLLAALVVTSGLMEDGVLAGVARPTGVLVGGLLAWYKAPFAVAVVGAAGTAAVLRLFGLP